MNKRAAKKKSRSGIKWSELQDILEDVLFGDGYDLDTTSTVNPQFTKRDVLNMMKDVMEKEPGETIRGIDELTAANILREFA